MSTIINVRALYRRPLRLGTTRISDTGDGTAIDLDDPVVRRDLYRHLGNWAIVEDVDASLDVPANGAIADLTPTAAGSVTIGAGDPGDASLTDTQALATDYDKLVTDVATLTTDFNAVLQALRDHNIIAP